MMLYPNCSSFVGRLDGTPVECDENGEEVPGHEADIYIPTDSGLMETIKGLMPVVEANMGLEELEGCLDNCGGGGNWDVVEKCIEVAALVDGGFLDIKCSEERK